MSSSDVPFKKGDAIVSHCKVFKIFKVTTKQTAQDDEETYIYYRPFFKTSRNSDITCSIAIKNLKKTNKRKPITEDQLNKLFSILEAKTKASPSSKQTAKKKRSSTNDIKDIINSNDVFKLTKMLKKLGTKKKKPDVDLSYSERQYFKRMLDHISQEVAYALGIDQQTAVERLQGYLE